MFSAIDHIIVAAYRETEYRVHAEQRFTLRMGEPSTELLAAQAARHVACSAFITAWNPYSEATDDVTNRQRQEALSAELTQRGLSHWPGIGQHPTNGWPGEESFLIFGLDLEAAKALATRLRQNAFVWTGADAVPQLILLR